MSNESIALSGVGAARRSLLDKVCGWLAKLLSVAMLVGLQPTSLPGQSHVAEPALNLGDTSFLDAPALPGFVLEQIADGTRAGRIVDATGKTIPGAGAVNSLSGLTHFAWIAHKGIFGAWYGNEIVVAAADVDATASGQAGGIGNLTVSPFLLQWSRLHLFHMAIDQRADLDFDFPPGHFSRSNPVTLTNDNFTVHPYYVITAHPTKRIETSWRVHYLWNSSDHAPPFTSKAESTQAGQAIHFNATAAYNVYKGLWIGPNAYFLSQITDAKVNGVALLNSPEKVDAIGPGAVYNYKKWFYWANEYQEFGAENRATGHKLVLRVTRVW
jgi:hypothetical protein